MTPLQIMDWMMVVITGCLTLLFLIGCGFAVAGLIGMVWGD